eukprot:gene25986-32500_t
MDILREVHHAQLFHLLAQDLAGDLTVEKLADHLSALADVIVAATVQAVWKTVATRHREVPQFAVIAYGKLGGKELGYISDLDVIFLFDDDDQDAPAHGGTDVLVYDNSGALMGAGTVGADGSWKVTVSNRNEYRGTVLIKGVDANGAAVNYLDEVSATSKSLDTTLRAMGVAEEGWGNFSVASDMTATLTINITP